MSVCSTSRLKNDCSDPAVSKPQEKAYSLPRFVAFCPSTGKRGHDCQPNQYFQVALKARILNGYTKYGSFCSPFLKRVSISDF